MELSDVLSNIGLNQKESRVYLAALELGNAPASEIAKKAHLNRVSTYDLLERLIKRGFISTYKKDRVSLFAATDPESLAHDLKERVQKFSKALPSLKRIHGSGAHPKVRYYEGIKAVKNIYLDTLSSKTEILNYADSKSIREHWPEYDEDYIAKRIEKGIYLRGISPKDEHGEFVSMNNKSSHREIRLVPPGEHSFQNEIHIYDDKVAIISFGKEVLGMIIQNDEIANTQRAIFMMAWQFSGGTS